MNDKIEEKKNFPFSEWLKNPVIDILFIETLNAEKNDVDYEEKARLDYQLEYNRLENTIEEVSKEIANYLEQIDALSFDELEEELAIVNVAWMAFNRVKGIINWSILSLKIDQNEIIYSDRIEDFDKLGRRAFFLKGFCHSIFKKLKLLKIELERRVGKLNAKVNGQESIAKERVEVAQKELRLVLAANNENPEKVKQPLIANFAPLNRNSALIKEAISDVLIANRSITENELKPFLEALNGTIPNERILWKADIKLLTALIKGLEKNNNWVLKDKFHEKYNYFNQFVDYIGKKDVKKNYSESKPSKHTINLENRNHKLYFDLGKNLGT